MFEGNFSSQIRENHNFICEHPIAQSLGICSTTYSSFSEIYNKLEKYAKNLFPNLPSKISDGYCILNLFGNPTGKYDYFNHATQVWVEKQVTTQRAIELIQFYESVKSGDIVLNPETDVNKYEEEIEIKNIKISNQGCIRFSFMSSTVSWIKDAEDSEEIIITLHFDSYAKSNNKRSLANKGPLMLADVPRTVTGKQYGFKETRNYQSTSLSNMASYFPTQPGGVGNVENIVAGQLETTYNKNTGRFEAGNRVVLAKIVDNTVGPAGIDNTPILNIPHTASDFYDVLGGNFNGQYTTGSAVILTCENSNPAMMGPNFVDCKNGEKLEKVRIINRTNNTYEVGTTVKLTNIDGFWCAEPYAGETRPKAPRFGEWSFAKLIANSDVYFKDNDYYTTGSKSRSVKDYEAQARSKFYYNQTYELIRNKDRGANEEVISQIRSNGNYNITDGLVDSNFFPANRYYISTVYDQLAEEYGGWSKVSVIGRTNMKLAERGNDVFFDQDCPFFWGPLFSNGYSYITFNEEYSAPDYIQQVTNPQLPMRGTEPDERLDPNHLPAETVSNILDFENIIYNYNQLGLVPISGVLTNKLLKPTYYGSTPIGLNSLQFVPLTFEFVGHNDIWSQARFLSDNANSARKIYESIDKYFQDLYSIDPSNRSTVGYFGNMFDRLGDRGKYIPVVDKISDVDAGFIFTGYCQQLYYKAYEGNPPSNVNSIAYDCYIRREPTSTPLGAPDYFNDTGEYLGANCVGIISAHNKITKKGGGDINIAVAHINIGLASNKQATGGGSLFSNFFDGMFLNMINTGAAARNVERAMWGSTSDNIDSFGTTALHIRIFDSWPEELTIFDPRYFAVLHFNPGDLYSIEGESSVDFASIDLAVGSIVEPRQEIPQIKNTIRRGQLLSNGGFKYKYKTLGLHPTLNQIAGTNNGSGFASGDTIKTGLPGEDGNPSVEITITTVNEEGGITGYTVTNPGVNYTVESFVRTDSTAENPTPIDVVPITLKSPAEGGRSAVIWFLNLIVVEIEKIDEGPKEHTPGPLRLTYASNGAGYINKTKETTINLPSNSTGQYDTYFHFHNDITHTAMLEHGSSQVIGFGQYLDMTIT